MRSRRSARADAQRSELWQPRRIHVAAVLSLQPHTAAQPGRVEQCAVGCAARPLHDVAPAGAGLQRQCAQRGTGLRTRFADGVRAAHRKRKRIHVCAVDDGRHERAHTGQPCQQCDRRRADQSVRGMRGPTHIGHQPQSDRGDPANAQRLRGTHHAQCAIQPVQLNYPLRLADQPSEPGDAARIPQRDHQSSRRTGIAQVPARGGPQVRTRARTPHDLLLFLLR